MEDKAGMSSHIAALSGHKDTQRAMDVLTDNYLLVQERIFGAPSPIKGGRSPESFDFA